MDLASGPVQLRFDKIVSFEPSGELVPFYHFEIIDRDNNAVGHINLRVGNTRHVDMVAGHVGFEITEEYRGNSYSLHACRSLKPLIKKHYDKVILTADPENAASIRIIEKLGARYVSEVEVPKDDPAHAGSATRKKRFECTVWKPSTSGRPNASARSWPPWSTGYTE